FSQSVVQAAVNEVTCNKVSIRSAAKKYNLDRSTLQRYVKRSGGKAASVRKCSMIFSVDEENALKQYITTSSKLFYGLTKQKARKLAFEYAQFKEKDIPSSWQNNKMAGEDWLKGFRRRQGSISLRSPESTSLARAMAFNQHNVSELFVKLKELYTRNNVPAQRVWNLDETGVNTVQNGGKVLCKTGSKQVRGVNVTMCCCINALGHCLPPAYIFPRVNFKSHMLKGAPSGSLGLANSSGWMKDTLFPTVLQHFISHMNVSCANPGILTMDNHSSHLSIMYIELARKSGLSILTFPPHCSHRLQPLDVCVFGPFKRFYGSFCD
uniref:HTH CENPB-type domain-containing protein n=1 Tax=Ciona savignyi TaxID=51511 RepID=H2Y7T0_CIOSA